MSNLYKVKEAADLLGVSVATIYLLCGQGRLAHVRVGVGGRGTIRIKADDLAAFIEANKAQPAGSRCAAGLKRTAHPLAGSP